MEKNSVRESSQIFGDSSLPSKRRRREGDGKERQIYRCSVNAVTPVKCTFLSLRSSLCLCICALLVGSIWETQEGKGIEKKAGIKIVQSYSIFLQPRVPPSSL